MRFLPFLVLAGVAALLASCGGNDGSAAPGAELSGRVTVFAAASLTDAFQEISAAFRAAHPRVEVVFNFGGSPTLRTQLEQGARADLYASADRQQMDLALRSGVVREPVAVFANNSLVVIAPKDNPGRISSLGDLRRGGLKLVLANPEVPAGAYARRALALMDADPAFGAGFSVAVLANVVSLESNVKQVVAKVELGEADAAIVYRTDVTPSLASKLVQIEISSRYDVVAEYPIAPTADAANLRLAQAFIDFVLSPAGQAALARYGFLPA